MTPYYETTLGTLYCGDCLEVMADLALEGVTVDAVMTDPPYGTTACKWDSIIPIEPMWEQLKRIIKPNGAIVMTASQPFTTKLIASNMKMFRYEWIWDKHIPRGMSQAKSQPMRNHENILVFSKTYPFNYYPIMELRDKPITVRNYQKKTDSFFGNYKDNTKTYTYTHKNPNTIICGYWMANKGKLHPTQKPIALMEYLIKTYTLENEIVLDFTIGSGTTAIAAIQTGRNFIGIEKDPKYYEIAKQRIGQAQPELFNNLDKTGS